MSGTILALFGVCLGSAMLDLLVPGEEKDGPKRFLHFFTALVVLLLILRPVTSLLQINGGFLSREVDFLEEDEAVMADYEKQFADAVATRSARELEEGLQALLADEFDLAAGTCTVTVTLEDGGGLETIDIRLSGSGLLQDPEAIERRLLELFNCVVEVR